MSDHLVDKSVISSLLRGKVIITLGIDIYLLDGLAGIFSKYTIQIFSCSHHMVRSYLYICALTRYAAAADEGLVYHDLAVRQSKAFALCARENRLFCAALPCWKR